MCHMLVNVLFYYYIFFLPEMYITTYIHMEWLLLLCCLLFAL